MHSRCSPRVVALVCLLCLSAVPSSTEIANAGVVENAAQGSGLSPRDDFDKDRIIVRFVPAAIEAAESMLSLGSNPLAKQARASRLDSLQTSIRLDTLRRAFEHRATSGAGIAARRHTAQRRQETYAVAIEAGRDIHEVLDEVRSHPDVAHAQLNYIYTPDLVPTDPQYASQYAHALTDAELGWDIETGDSSIAIAIIGTGVELLHPDLAANIWQNTGETPGNSIDDDLNGFVDDVNGWDFLSGDNDPTPVGSTHETAVAGVAGAAANNAEGVAGVAWNCRIMPLRVAYTSIDVAAAIDYATENGAKVINMSFGNYDPPKYGPDSIVEDAVDDAFAAGIVLIATAGNDNTADVRYPAGLDPVIAVAATTDIDERASFSNYGSWITLAAPGDDILSTSGPTGYATVDGTSFAAPYVAGVAALLLSADGSLSPTSVRHRIEYSVDEITPDLFIGTGRVNLANALALTSDPDHYAVIKSPLDGSAAIGLTGIVGTALGDSYTLEYRLLGDPNWIFLDSGLETIDGELGELDESALDNGTYELRLTVTLDAATKDNQSEVVVSDIKDGWPQSTIGGIQAAPAYADIDGDGDSEIFIGTSGGRVSAWYSDGTSIAGWPVTAGSFAFGSPAIGDIDDDGELDIVQSSSSTGSVYAFDRDGSALPGWPQNVNEKIRGAAVLADLDGDTVLDVIAAGQKICAGGCPTDGKVAAFGGDGVPLAGWPVDVEFNVQSTPVVGDIDGDTIPEVIVHGWTTLYAFHYDGSPVAGWPITYTNIHTSPLLVDYDGDGAYEILAIGGASAQLRAGDGTLIRQFTLSGGTNYAYAGIGEIDGIGTPEFCVGGDDGTVNLLRLDGGPLPGWPVAAGDDVSGCAFADVDADGQQEVVATSKDGFIHAWELDASPLSSPWPLPLGSPILGSLAVGDLDNNASLDIMAGAGAALFVFELEAATPFASADWPMLQGGTENNGRYVPEPESLLLLLSGLVFLRAAYPRKMGQGGGTAA